VGGEVDGGDGVACLVAYWCGDCVEVGCELLVADGEAGCVDLFELFA
jgi:hypothetical protein